MMTGSRWHKMLLSHLGGGVKIGETLPLPYSIKNKSFLKEFPKRIKTLRASLRISSRY